MEPNSTSEKRRARGGGRDRAPDFGANLGLVEADVELLGLVEEVI